MHTNMNSKFYSLSLVNEDKKFMNSCAIENEKKYHSVLQEMLELGTTIQSLKCKVGTEEGVIGLITEVGTDGIIHSGSYRDNLLPSTNTDLIVASLYQ